MIALACILAGLAAAAMGILGFLAYKYAGTVSEIGHLRDLLDDALKREDALTDRRDELVADVDRLKPALATSDALLLSANARITELLDEAAAKQKDLIDATPSDDLVALSHRVLSHGGAADRAGAGDDHDPAKAVPGAGAASGR